MRNMNLTIPSNMERNVSCVCTKNDLFCVFSSFANSCKHGQWSSPVNIVCYILAFLVYLIEFILLNIVSLAIAKLKLYHLNNLFQ